MRWYEDEDDGDGDVLVGSALESETVHWAGPAVDGLHTCIGKTLPTQMV